MREVSLSASTVAEVLSDAGANLEMLANKTPTTLGREVLECFLQCALEVFTLARLPGAHWQSPQCLSGRAVPSVPHSTAQYHKYHRGAKAPKRFAIVTGWSEPSFSSTVLGIGLVSP